MADLYPCVKCGYPLLIEFKGVVQSGRVFATCPSRKCRVALEIVPELFTTRLDQRGFLPGVADSKHSISQRGVI